MERIRNYVAVDVETTGLNPVNDRLIEVAAIKVIDFEVVQVFTTLINPGIKIPGMITGITGITDQMVRGAPQIKDVIHEMIEFCAGNVLLGHNLRFDYGFIKQNCMNHKLEFEAHGLDTLKMARKLLPDIERRNLDYLCSVLKIKDENHHRAQNDAMAASSLYTHFLEYYDKEGSNVFEAEKLSYSGVKVSPITARQKAFLRALLAYHKVPESYDLDILTKNEASRIIDKIIFTYGKMK